MSIQVSNALEIFLIASAVSLLSLVIALLVSVAKPRGFGRDTKAAIVLGSALSLLALLGSMPLSFDKSLIGITLIQIMMILFLIPATSKKNSHHTALNKALENARVFRAVVTKNLLQQAKVMVVTFPLVYLLIGITLNSGVAL